MPIEFPAETKNRLLETMANRLRERGRGGASTGQLLREIAC